MAVGLTMAGPTDVVFEGEQAAFTLRLSQPSPQAESVFITTKAGSATLGVDYMAPARQQVLFAPGQTVQRFSIPTLAEAVPRTEGVETFFVTATAANKSLAGPLTTTVRILDFQPQPTISINDVSITEGNTGTTTVTFDVRLSSPYARRVSVSYSTRDESATAGSDYVAAAGTLEFTPGETLRTVSVTVNGDLALEPNETFSLVLSSPVSANLGRAAGVCTIVNDERDTAGFQLTLEFNNPALPAAQKAVFESAAARLQQIIVGDVPGVTLPSGQFIDDVRIQVYVEAMDPETNGFARSLQWRTGPRGLPYDGEIRINSARIGNPGIYHTIIHEYLHALGFSSTFFERLGIVSGLGNANPLFTGANAVREFGSVFGIPVPTGVPLYGDLMAPGSYGSHWDTATFGTEIISVGWDTMNAGLRPFSRITVGAMQDLGYQVNYGAADPFTPTRDLVVFPVMSESGPTGSRVSTAVPSTRPAVAPTPPVAVRTTSGTTPSTPAFGKAAPRASVAAVPALAWIRMSSASQLSKTPRVSARL